MSENYLKHLVEFQKLLTGYTPRVEFIDALKDMKLVLLTSPAATGKNTIINQLLLTGRYQHLVSDTTRHPRINNDVPEVNGKEYWFRSELEFLDGLKHGDYITAEIIHEQQVSAINLSEIINAKSQNKVALAEVNIHGAAHINDYSDNILPIFLLPPNYEEWMRRLESRGQVSDDEKMRRVRSARDEIRYALTANFFTFMINSDIRITSQKIDELAVTGKPNEEHESVKKHAEAFLARLIKQLG